MEFSIEKYVSNFVESQFPQFYLEEGENFVLFAKAYYEWMEQSGNPVHESRSILEYRDIDTTPEKFLEFFQKKYLYGIPFGVITSKRFLLKHILDVYRSKGTIQCYKLLFKLIYNEDIETYLPGIDVLRLSDGTWIEPKFLESTEIVNDSDYIGKTIIGVSSGTTAIVESIIRELNDNSQTLTLVYLSNILPKGGDFDIGEKFVPVSEIENDDFIFTAPKIFGSPQTLNITAPGRDFELGEIVKVSDQDYETFEKVTAGKEGYFKVTGVEQGYGTLIFDIEDGGLGYSVNSAVYIYRNSENGYGADFDVGQIVNPKTYTFNTDVITPFLSKKIDISAYGLAKNPSGNGNSTLASCLTYQNGTFGTISSLTNIDAGSNYTKAPNVFVKSVVFSTAVAGGNVHYTITNNIVTFSSDETINTFKDIYLDANSYLYFTKKPTANVSSLLEDTISLVNFYNLFSNNDVIGLKADSANASTFESQVIKEVVSPTTIILYGNPDFNSTNTAQFFVAPVTFSSNFAPYEPAMINRKGGVNGTNARIVAEPRIGNKTLSSVVAIDGKGYIKNEKVKIYRAGVINSDIQIINPGVGYANGETVVFIGGISAKQASAYVTTDDNGSITAVTLTNPGSGYFTYPEIRIRTTNGSGAVLYVRLDEFDYTQEAVGRIIKKGIGQSPGYWSTDRGFLDANKYIQDSYYYQDYSYEIKVAKTLDKYKNILYETFHSSGSELFGKFLLINVENAEGSILHEEVVS